MHLLLLSFSVIETTPFLYRTLNGSRAPSRPHPPRGVARSTRSRDLRKHCSWVGVVEQRVDHVPVDPPLGGPRQRPSQPVGGVLGVHPAVPVHPPVHPLPVRGQ